MLYFWLIVLSLILTFLVLRFIEKIAYVAGIMLGLMLLGIVIIPFNPDLGIKLAAYMFGILACLAVIFLFSSFLSIIIVAPIMMIWGSVKGLFKRD
jgi:hypothetical protein